MRVVHWIFMISCVIYTICAGIKCVQQKSLESFSVTYIDFLVASQTGIKAISLYLKRERLSKILDVIWNDFWPIDKIESMTEKHNKIYQNTLKYSNGYKWLLIACIIQISTFALLQPLRTLPYNLYFFGYEHNLLLQTPIYQITYVVELLTLSVPYALCLIGFDMIFMVLIGCCCAQFDMLRERLLQIRDADEETADEILRECVHHHNLLLKFVVDLEAIVTIPILKQYLDAVTCMGVYLYLAQQKIELVHVFSLGSNLSQTLLFSTFGQLIQNRSSAIAYGAYDNNWHLIPNRKLQQALILVTLRAQRVTRLSAGGFIYLSFESFLGMLKAAGSFLAVLRSTKEEK